jgi:hypothetical protein
MIELVLKNNIKQEKMDALLHFLKVWEFDIEIKNVSQPPKNNKNLSFTTGLWEDYDIDDQILRSKAWGTDKRVFQ